jgi:hypothetical protein
MNNNAIYALNTNDTNTHINMKKSICYRCKREGHFAKNCYASTYENGKLIEDFNTIWQCEYCDNEFETKNEAISHEKTCKKPTKKLFCTKCKRYGHTIDKCYASTYKNGNKMMTKNYQKKYYLSNT